MTYSQAQYLYRKRYGKTVKTCWIADVLSSYGKTKRQSWNRIGSKPMYPCPHKIKPKLEVILKELGMI